MLCRSDTLFFYLVFLIYLISPVISSGQNSKQVWKAEIRYVNVSELPLLKEQSRQSDTLYHFYFMERILIITGDENAANYGWCRVVYPKHGFVEERYLFTDKDTDKFGKQISPPELHPLWTYEIKYCSETFALVRRQPKFDSENIGIIQKNEPILIILEKDLKERVWYKTIYPIEGFIYSNDFMMDEGYDILSFGGSLGFLQIPYERNFDNYRIPLGLFLEYTRSNWDLNFRAGYTNSQSNISTYILKTDLIYLTGSYTLFRFFKESAEVFLMGGVGIWYSSFQNTKYPTLTEYFKEEKQDGMGYLLGAGFRYNFPNLFAEIQYLFIGTREAKFGPYPVPGEFTNQYLLYPASNHFGISIGYRINFQ